MTAGLLKLNLWVSTQPAIVNKNMTYILIDLQYGRTVYMWKAFPGSAKYITISEMTYMYS